MRKERHFRYAMASLFMLSSVTALVHSYSHQRAIAEYTEVVQQADVVVGRLRAARKLLATLADAETGQRGYLLTGDSAYRTPFDKAVTLIPTPAAGDSLKGVGIGPAI